jgi:hypothetical protein
VVVEGPVLVGADLFPRCGFKTPERIFAGLGVGGDEFADLDGGC